jgi:SAM-dependent methyltransferase
MNTDNLFPLFYHAQHQSYQADLPFWLGLAAAQGSPILELGCGTGRVLLPLARAGYTVYGLDNNHEMLEFLAMRLDPDLQATIHLIQTDMTQFHFAAKFGLILLPCNTLSTLTKSALRGLFACVSRHLPLNGVFAASLPNPQLLLHMPKKSGVEIEETFFHPIDGKPVQVSSAWKHDNQVFTLSWYYDHLLPDGRIEHLETIVQHQIEPVQFYLHCLEEAGFHPIQLFGDFDRRPYRKTSTNLIILARKSLP